ncbi:MAG TPA: DUF4249 domain-containing protein [Bacteroidales bacterium]|nr:DUF4249 domain-containing protein [Bacteroidales bacterium]
MQVIRVIITILAGSLVSFACIEPFTPDIAEYQDLMVINGSITDQAGYHNVDVSCTSSFNDPVPRPERNCNVRAYDDKGNIFQYDEVSPGIYRCWIDKQYLIPYTRYRVEVITSDGILYQSDWDVMLPCADIEKVYYEVSEEAPSNPLLSPFPGLQFFINTTEMPDRVSNYRWELRETWEYHSTYGQGDYYDGEIHYVESDNYADSLVYCWRSGPVKEIFTMSTRSFASNKITRGFLNFVSNQTDRLSVKYSLLVKQYSLSDSAFEYWSRMQRLIQESGGLYETQPIRITGNIRNPNDPDETVLGFFWASAEKKTRIFYQRGFEFPVVEPPCQRYYLTEDALMEYLQQFDEESYPIFLINTTMTPEGPWDAADQTCFDCTKRGGTLIKPDFWE